MGSQYGCCNQQSQNQFVRQSREPSSRKIQTTPKRELHSTPPPESASKFSQLKPTQLQKEQQQTAKNFYQQTMLRDKLDDGMASLLKSKPVDPSYTKKYKDPKLLNTKLGPYYGQTKDGVPHGRGQLITKHAFVQGHFNEGQVDGEGIAYLKSDPTREHSQGTFRGYFKNNAPYNGVYQNKQLKYEGQFIDFMKHGEGSQYYTSNGDTFRGLFEKGQKKNGQYTYSTHPLIKNFEGTFDGKQPKEGSIQYFDGTILRDAKLNKGFIYWARAFYKNGDTYEGEMKESVRSGKGKYFTKKDGSIYQGYFTQNLRDGQGVLTVNGQKFNVTYQDGRIHKIDEK